MKILNIFFSLFLGLLSLETVFASAVTEPPPPPAQVNAQTIAAYRTQMNAWLDVNKPDEPRFGVSVPDNRRLLDFSLRWHASRAVGVDSAAVKELKREAAELRRLEEAARREAEERSAALAIVRRERDHARRENALGRMGGDSRLAEIITQVREGKVELAEIIFDEAAHEIAITLQETEGERRRATEVRRYPDERAYQEAKQGIEFFQAIFSRQYNAAAGALGDFVAETFRSAQPMDFHLRQAEHLATVSQGMRDYIQYHQTANGELTPLLPLRSAFVVRFAREEILERLRAETHEQFGAILARVGPLMVKPSISAFVEKIQASINLPTDIKFTKEEIRQVLREAGLLLRTRMEGETEVLDLQGAYAQNMEEFYHTILSKIKTLEGKVDLKEDDEWKDGKSALFLAISEANPEKIERAFGEFVRIYQIRAVGDMMLALNMTDTVIAGLRALLERAFSSRDVEIYEREEPLLFDLLGRRDLQATQALLFLIKEFYSEFDTIQRIILSKSMSPFAQGVFILDLRNRGIVDVFFQDVKEGRVVRVEGIGNAFQAGRFAFDSYGRLKKAEGSRFVRRFLQSKIEGAEGERPNIDQLKERVLTIDLSTPTKLKTKALLKLGDFIEGPSDAFIKPLDTAAISRLSGHPAFDLIIRDYELQTNAFQSADAQAKFVNAYLRGDRPNYADLTRFLEGALDFAAQDVPFVKVVLELPTHKRNVERDFDQHRQGIGEFLEETARFRDLEGAFRTVAMSEDDRRILDAIFTKIRSLRTLADQFLRIRDEAAAIVEVDGARPAVLGAEGVTVGLTALQFDELSQARVYYGSPYNAMKILHRFDLQALSGIEREFLNDQIARLARAEDRESFQQILARHDQLKQSATKLYQTIKTYFAFAKKFHEDKQTYEDDENDPMDFYVAIDRLVVAAAATGRAGPPMPGAGIGPRPMGPPAGLLAALRGRGEGAVVPPHPPVMPRPMAGPPRPAVAGAGVGAQVAGCYAAVEFVRPLKDVLITDFDFHKQIDREKAAQITVKSNQGPIALPKLDYYRRVLAGQLEYLSHINLNLVKKEEDVNRLLSQVFATLDLYIRLELFNRLRTPGIVSKDREFTRNFAKRYLDIFGGYTLGSIGPLYGARPLSEQTATATTLILQGLAPEIRRAILGTLFDRLRASNFQEEDVDLVSGAKRVIDDAILARPIVIDVDGGRKNIDGAVLQGIVPVPKTDEREKFWFDFLPAG